VTAILETSAHFFDWIESGFSVGVGMMTRRLPMTLFSGAIAGPRLLSSCEAFPVSPVGCEDGGAQMAPVVLEQLDTKKELTLNMSALAARASQEAPFHFNHASGSTGTQLGDER
jgi:hypothetical protein